MREKTYFEECHESEGFVIGVVLGILAMLIVASVGGYHSDKSDELSCREGKLYEVTHEGNITIYDPTFDECEEAK